MKNQKDTQMNNAVRPSFDEIYTSYYKQSVFFVKSYIHDDLAAEDIVTESLIKLWERLKEENIDYIGPLLLTILKNKALDYLKHEEVRRAAFESISDWRKQELSIRISTLELCDPNELFSNEIEDIIQKTLDSLLEQTRQIFLLSRFEKKSHTEIADHFGITTKGVEYHISKALKALRLTLKDYLPLFIIFLRM